MPPQHFTEQGSARANGEATIVSEPLAAEEKKRNVWVNPLDFVKIVVILHSTANRERGCFGTIEAAPWHAFALDVAALVLLAVGQPSWRAMQTVPRGALWRIVSPAAHFVLGVWAIFACFVGIGAWAYGSPEAALARLRGETTKGLQS